MTPFFLVFLCAFFAARVEGDTTVVKPGHSAVLQVPAVFTLPVEAKRGIQAIVSSDEGFGIPPKIGLIVRLKYGAIPKENDPKSDDLVTVSRVLNLTHNSSGYLAEVIEPSLVKTGNWYLSVERGNKEDEAVSVRVDVTNPELICGEVKRLSFCGPFNHATPMYPLPSMRNEFAEANYNLLRDALSVGNAGPGCGADLRNYFCTMAFPGCTMNGLVLDMCSEDCSAFSRKCLSHFNERYLCNATDLSVAESPNCTPFELSKGKGITPAFIAGFSVIAALGIGFAAFSTYRYCRTRANEAPRRVGYGHMRGNERILEDDDGSDARDPGFHNFD